MKTDEELKTIATDLYKEKIFCDRHLRDPKNELTMVFMALIFLDEKGHKEIQDKKPVFIYEYLDNSANKSINGYPIFYSFRFLNQEEFNKMWKYYESIKESVNKI